MEHYQLPGSGELYRGFMQSTVLDRERLPEFIFRFADVFHKAGEEVYLVGGTLRDLLHKPSYLPGEDDFDFATSARPEKVRKLFRRTIPTGIQHGTVTVLFGGHSLEVTTFRADGDYSDGRRPDEVSFSDTIEEDVKRRDFTINAMALDLDTLRVVDIYGGMEDLSKGLIRAVGDPLERFLEDGLRPLRACRFAGKLGFSIEEGTFEAISGALHVFRQVAVERVREELLKIMSVSTPSVSLEAMRKSGLLEIVLPELVAGYGIEQNEFHKYDIYYHNLASCDAADPGTPLIRLAALLHDVGKVRARENALRRNPDGDAVFYNHEVIGARMADRILRRLRFSNNDRNYICHLIKHHMFHYTDEWTDGAVRRLMRNVGVDVLPDLFALRRADRAGNGKKQGPAKSLQKLSRRIRIIEEAENAITVRDLKVNGRDLMERLSLEPGPLIGDTLEYLLEYILDDPDKNEADELMRLAGEFIASRRQ